MEYATGAAARRERVRELREPVAGVPAAGRRDDRAARRRARRPRAAGGGAPMLDEMSKRAQERVLLAQVGREIQANLRHMEQVLDAFFRDNGKRADLATLTKDSQQIRGALRSSASTRPSGCSGCARSRSRRYADPETPVSNDDLELLAESLSGLGFYIEAVEQQRPDRDRLIAPLIAKRLGEAPAPRRRAARFGRGRGRASCAPQLPALRRGSAPRAGRRTARARACGRSSPALRDDAELIGDADLVGAGRRGAQGARRRRHGEPHRGRRRDRGHAARRRPRSPTKRSGCSTVDAHGLDAELLDIYLTEAGEVLDSDPRAARDALEQQPRRPRGAAHGPPRLPHAEGLRPHGRPDRARRVRVRRREDPQPAARGRAAGDALPSCA